MKKLYFLYALTLGVISLTSPALAMLDLTVKKVQKTDIRGLPYEQKVFVDANANEYIFGRPIYDTQLTMSPEEFKNFWRNESPRGSGTGNFNEGDHLHLKRISSIKDKKTQRTMNFDNLYYDPENKQRVIFITTKSDAPVKNTLHSVDPDNLEILYDSTNFSSTPNFYVIETDSSQKSTQKSDTEEYEFVTKPTMPKQQTTSEKINTWFNKTFNPSYK